MILYEKNYELILVRYIEGIRENKRNPPKRILKGKTTETCHYL